MSEDEIISVEPKLQNFNGSVLDAYRALTGYSGGATVRLMVGELGLGTRLTDREIYEGWNTFAEINGYGDIVNEVIIGGGVLPELPPFYSTGNVTAMRFLGKVTGLSEREDTPTRLEHVISVLKGKKDAEHFTEFKEKYLEGKIETWDDCVEAAQDSLGLLLESLNPTNIEYQWGDEDFFNIKYEEEIKVNALQKQVADYLKGLNQQDTELNRDYTDVTGRINSLEEKLERLDTERKVLSDIRAKARSYKSGKEEPDISGYLENLLFTQEDTLFYGLSLEKQKNALRTRLKKVTSWEDLVNICDDKKSVYSLSRKELKEEKRRRDNINKRLRVVHADLAELQRIEEMGSQIAFFTKRGELSPSEAEWLYKAVKDEYTERLENCFPEEVRDKLVTHISNFTRIDNLSAEDDVFLDSAEVSRYGGTMLIHNTRFRSNSTSFNDLSDAQKEILFRRALQAVSTEEENYIPKLVVVAHGAGGFGVTRINSEPDYCMINGNEREEPFLVSLVSLPVAQDTDKLLKYHSKRMKNWGTKRFDQKVHASGFTIQYVLDDGSELWEYIDTSGLKRIAQQKRFIEAQRDSGELSPQEKDKLTSMCSRTFKIRAMLGDAHIGSGNFLGTPSNYLRLERSIGYLTRVYGESLDELILTEMVDGNLAHTKSGEKTNGASLKEIQNRAILELQNLPDSPSVEDFLGCLEVVLREYEKSIEGNPIANLESQYEALRPYLSDLIKGLDLDQVTVIAGNHPRSKEGADEADRLYDMIRSFDEKVGILKVTGRGHKFGGQGGVPSENIKIDGKIQQTGRSVGYYHEPKGGKNALVRTLQHLLNSGYAFREFFAGHIHTSYAGFANGTAVSINPPIKGPDDYSEFLSVKPTPYGTLIKYSDTTPRHPDDEVITHAWHFVNDDTLEAPEHANNQLQTVIDFLKISAKVKARTGRSKVRKGPPPRNDLSTEVLKKVLKETGGNVTKAASELGRDRNWMIRATRRHGLGEYIAELRKKNSS